MRLPSAIILSAVIALLTVSPGLAQSSPTEVAFAPASSAVAVGANVPVDITVANVAAPPGLGGYDISLSFDPAVVRLDSLADSGFITSGQLLVVCAQAQIDNRAGTAQLICTPFQFLGAQGVGVSSPVALAHASFTALAPGTSTLSLSGSTVAGPSGGTLTATFESGSITVQAPVATPHAAAPGASDTPPPNTTAEPPATAQVSATAQALAVAPAAAFVTPYASAGSVAAASTARTPLHAPATGTGGGGDRSARWLRPTSVELMVVAFLVLIAGGVLMLRRPTDR